jgi:hypothetical protein
MVLFIIAVTLTILSIIGIVLVDKFAQKSFGSTWLGPIFIVALLVSVIFGLVVIPLLRTVNTEYVEMHNCIILKSKDAVIIDLTNSPDSWTTFENLKKFNTYKAVMEFSDSTKIFREIDRSFYHVPVNNRVVWSNPPYKDFYKE